MQRLNKSVLISILVCCLGILSESRANPPSDSTSTVAKNSQQQKSDEWKPVLGKWTACQFGGDGDVQIQDDQIVVRFGDPLTGFHWQRQDEKDQLLRDNYELRLKAKRTDGFDFFCGLTFPIADEHATLVLGGWGGGITGLSSIDGLDASENETTVFRRYETDQWYEIRVRVDPFGVRCWVDNQLVVEVVREGHKFGLRFEMEFCEPLGIAAYQCEAVYKKIEYRKLNAVDLKKATAKKMEWAEE